MTTKRSRQDVIASARRSHRNALRAANEAVRAYGKKNESRRELSFGMLLLLGEIVGDTDGSDTLDLMEDFEESYFGRLKQSDDGCVLCAAIHRLEIEAKILNTLVMQEA
jgi:hypothetical protein